MNEYNEYNFESTSGTETPKAPRKRILLKITAALLAFSIVSAGSIGVYSYIDRGTAALSSAEESTAALPKTSASAEPVKYITSAESSGERLTVEEIVEKCFRLSLE